MAQLPTEAAPFVGRPPLDRIGAAGPGSAALRRYVEHETRPWGGVPMPFPAGMSAALWMIAVANTGLGVWLTAVVRGAVRCSGAACTIATWGHPGLLLVLATSCVAALVGTSVVTRGLSEAGAVPLVVVLLGAVSGLVAVTGLVALLVIATVCLLLIVVVLAALIDRF